MFVILDTILALESVSLRQHNYIHDIENAWKEIIAKGSKQNVKEIMDWMINESVIDSRFKVFLT